MYAQPQPVPIIVQQPVYVQSQPQPQNNVVVVRNYSSGSWIACYVILTLLILGSIIGGCLYAYRRRIWYRTYYF